MATDRAASVHLDIDPLASRAEQPREIDESPFDIVLVGDFSGRDSFGDAAPHAAPGRPRAVDRDDFDDVLARIAPRIRLRFAPGTTPIDIAIQDIDDFHPDRLLQGALFAELRELRRRAHDPAALPDVTARLGLGPDRPATPPPAPADQPGGGVLDLILDRTEPAPAGGAAQVEQAIESGLADIVRRLVAPHLVARADPRQDEAVAAIDGALADGLRTLLHHPSFQAVEALWRAVFLLVRQVETGPQLRVHLVDVSRRELEMEMAGERPDLQRFARRLMPGEPHRSPTVIALAHPIGSDPDDLTLLATLAELGFALEAPILAAASPSLMGAANARALASPEDWSAPSEAFQQLRHSPAAPYLGLLLPRFLLRAPYGRDGEECELRGFEELESASADEDLLWGSPAVAAAMLLGSAFADAGWEMRPGAHREIERLPLVHREGEPVPSAEVWLTESAAERILDRGVMPVASVRHSDSAHLVRFQSIASPAAPLAGRWTTSRP